jgi:CubicO group peptidase (beta-lactamase class C family)
MPVSSSLPRSLPEAQGVSSSAILAFVRRAEKEIDSLHSFMLLRRGAVIADGWWYPYRADVAHEMYSLTKSFTSTAVGLAVSEGRLSVEDPVLSFFPEDAPKRVGPNLAAMRVKHLLSMVTGHDQDTTERIFAPPTRNPARAFLALDVEHAPGTHFVYNSGASHMLSILVQKCTGQSLLEYLTPRLFEPLGIRDVMWDRHADGVDFGGWGLHLKTEDIARFGQLYLQKGVWNGRRLLPEAWVEQATSKQVPNGDDPENDWNQGYGYQFWRCRHNIYRGDGAFGQYCIVMPGQDAVLAITSGVPDMQKVLDVVWDTFLPAMEKQALPPDPGQAGKQALELKDLSLLPPRAGGSSPLAEQLSGKTYIFGPNDATLQSLSFDFKAARLVYQLTGEGMPRGKQTLPFGVGNWVDGGTFLSGSRILGQMVATSVAAAGTWAAQDTFVLTLCQYETPYLLTLTCRFEGEKLYCDLKVNVSFGPTALPQLVGDLEK